MEDSGGIAVVWWGYSGALSGTYEWLGALGGLGAIPSRFSFKVLSIASDSLMVSLRRLPELASFT